MLAKTVFDEIRTREKTLPEYMRNLNVIGYTKNHIFYSFDGVLGKMDVEEDALAIVRYFYTEIETYVNIYNL